VRITDQHLTIPIAVIGWLDAIVWAERGWGAPRKSDHNLPGERRIDGRGEFAVSSVRYGFGELAMLVPALPAASRPYWREALALFPPSTRNIDFAFPYRANSESNS
jgi:hypothetical protein